MICKHITKRSYQRRAYLYCRKLKRVITFDKCKNCLKIEPRENKDIIKRTPKQNKLERDRDKGLMKTGYCECCGRWSSRLDPHEVYGGSNRKRSIQNGLVKRICRQCHSNEELIMDLRKEVQKEYEKTHTREEFIKLIGKSYLD